MPRRLAAALALGAVLFATPAANAAGPPLIAESWVTEVTATGAKLRALIKPNGLPTTYRFEYVTEAAFQAKGFLGAAKVPASGAAPIGAGSPPPVVQSLGPPANSLIPASAYRFRTVATNSEGTTTGPERVFATQEGSLFFALPDDRGWEMVSPIDKGGGGVAAPGQLFGGGQLQGAASGGALTYSSSTSFGERAEGAPPASQYISRRSESGWSTENVSAPLASAAYGDEPDGAPYRLFSSELSTSLLFGGLPCRGGLAGCPAPTPVLGGSGAPPGYMAYYLRDGAGSYASLLSASDLAHTGVTPEHFEVGFAAASPDLANVVLTSCAALSANATEAPAGPGECDAAKQNLYLWSSSGLKLLNLKPGDSTGTPGAELAAPIGALSDNGSRVYWVEKATEDLYLREGSQSFGVEETGAGSFEAASSDGAVAFFSKEELGTGRHLFRFIASTQATTDLTPSGGLAGVLGASPDGSRVYYQDASGLKLWQNGTTTTIAPGPSASAPSNYPPATGSARISADGTHLAFLSKAELIPYDNAGRSEAYLYGPPPGGGAPVLVCASCNPTGERPQGPSSIPGVLSNGTTQAYKPRALSAAGSRLFFDSNDELVTGDSNAGPDVYQWEANGVGDCTRSPGCIGLISSGKDPEGASFIDASADGADVYFLTAESLLGEDPGSIDVYDAREGGGFTEAQKPIACIADACQSLPAPPEDPTPGTLTKNSGNPPPAYFGQKPRKGKKHHKKKKHEGHGKEQGAKNGKGAPKAKR